MRKACERHGPFEDVLSNHRAFFKRMESLGFGKDFNCAGDELVHNHGANGIKTGRGTYLIVDLTNRCNMFCSPCYMDANAAGYVHELDMQDVTALFERAKSFKPQREINVLFSGGEATLSPIFLDAIQQAKSVGFHRLHVATNGIRFAQEKEFAVRAKAAGLHGVYLQFDGVTEEKNSHRGIGNYMETKLRALDNIAAAGMKTTLQVTVVNGLNNDGVGDIIRFVADHLEKIHGIIFQPVMFCGRDEDISADERYAKRYPVSQIAYDLQAQTSFGWEPMRDWFPVSAYGAFAHLCDILHPDAGEFANDVERSQNVLQIDQPHLPRAVLFLDNGIESVGGAPVAAAGIKENEIDLLHQASMTAITCYSLSRPEWIWLGDGALARKRNSEKHIRHFAFNRP